MDRSLTKSNELLGSACWIISSRGDAVPGELSEQRGRRRLEKKREDTHISREHSLLPVRLCASVSRSFPECVRSDEGTLKGLRRRRRVGLTAKCILLVQCAGKRTRFLLCTESFCEFASPFCTQNARELLQREQEQEEQNPFDEVSAREMPVQRHVSDIQTH